MYILSKHFDNPEQEIICPLTGESYVYLEGSDLTLIDSKYHEGALEILPRRFSQQNAILFPSSNGQGRVFIKKPYDH